MKGINGSVVSRLSSRPGIVGLILLCCTLAIGAAISEISGKSPSGISVEIAGFDRTPPAIAALPNPAANSAGWNNSNVTVAFNCADQIRISRSARLRAAGVRHVGIGQLRRSDHD